MPHIRPFKGIRYNNRKIKDISTVVAPPYDIIPPRMQSDLYRAHPCNVVRLILGKTGKKDTSVSNQHTRARKFLDQWTREGILVRDDTPAIYVYSQEYKYNGKRIERTGFLALMDLEGSGKDKVLPHENTLAAPKMDRLKLIRQVEANLSPIFVLYEDPRHSIMGIFNRFRRMTPPVIDFRQDSVRNRLWRMEDPGYIKTIESLMRAKSTFIADGHHRFETARNYHAEVLKKRVPQSLKDNSRYMMVYFVESDERMLTILPAHRAIRNIRGLKKNDILEKLGKYFTITKASSLKSLESGLAGGRGRHTFGMYLGRGDMRILELIDVSRSDAAIKDKPKDWKRLDVSILHNFIVQYVLGLGDSDDNVEFIKDPMDTIKAVDSGRSKLAFFLNPTKASEVRKIAMIGECMPRKATYFYPKPLSGLVINKF